MRGNSLHEFRCTVRNLDQDISYDPFWVIITNQGASISRRKGEYIDTFQLVVSSADRFTTL